MDNSVRIDIKCDFDLWNATWRWSDSGEFKHSESLVVSGHFAFALEDLNLHCRLIVISGSKDFRTLGRNCGVTFDELGHDSTLSLDTERKWSHIKKKYIFNFALDNAGLEARAYSHNFIRIYALIWLFSAGELFDEIHNGWHTS